MREQEQRRDDDLGRHLRTIRARLRTLASEADRMTGRIEALATLLDGHVSGGGLARAGHVRRAAGGSRRPRREAPIVGVLRHDVRSDGSIVVHADALLPIVLAGAPATLFCYLARPDGRVIGDGLVGYKPASEVLHHLAARQNKYVTRRALVQLVYRLRQTLARGLASGDGLVEYRRGRGYRIRVRQAQP